MIPLPTNNTPEEKKKLTILYEKYRLPMWKTAMNVLNDPFLAEDAVHNAFVGLVKNINHMEEPDSLSTKKYLFTAARNAAIDIFRTRQRQMQREIYADGLEEMFLPSAYIETDLENSTLDLLKNLPEKYRDVFLLKYDVQMENHEIAKELGISESAVRQRIARGKPLIMRKLKETYYN